MREVFSVLLLSKFNVLFFVPIVDYCLKDSINAKIVWNLPVISLIWYSSFLYRTVSSDKIVSVFLNLETTTICALSQCEF